MRTRKITNEFIQNGCIDCVYAYGLENFTTKKVAKLLEIAEGSIYNYYTDTRQVLKDTFCAINQRINAALLTFEFPEDTTLLAVFDPLWHTYLDYLLEHQPEAKFYYAMTHSNYYTEDLREVHTKLLYHFQVLLQNRTKLSDAEAAFTITYIVDITLSFAYRCGSDTSGAGKSDIDMLYKLLSGGLTAVLKND